MASDGDSRNPCLIVLHRLFPAFKVDRPRKGHKHDKLSECQVRPLRDGKGGFKGFRPVARQAKYERTQHLHAMLGESAQTVDQFFSRGVEVLVNIFQSLGRDRLNANERSFDLRFTHGVEKDMVFSSFHCDLCEKHHVWRTIFSKALHEFKTFRPDCVQLIPPLRVPLTRSQLEIREGDGVEIVVGKQDKSKSQAPQMLEFLNNRVRAADARTLTIGSPYRAERAMFGASSDGLYGSPHISIAWH